MSLRPIVDVAADLGVRAEDLDPRGRHVAKLPLSLAGPRRGRLVLVTGITPTRQGEGKTLTVVGLTQALRRLGKRAAATLRQPSMAPLFGSKGGATGGGRSSVEPATSVNLHLTGDAHAVTAAQNLVAALADAHVHHGNALGIDPASPPFPRCLDVNDRSLRRVGATVAGQPREAPFVVTAASEAMGVFSLASSYADLRRRLGEMVVGLARDGRAVTAADVGARGAAAAVLRDALSPNLLQTTEGAPAIVHGGPFGNVSHGHNSRVADDVALSLADVVVTESGFATELGAEKYVGLLMSQGGAPPDVAVLVASVRALRSHGAALGAKGDDALAAGFANLDAHLGVLRTLGLPAVVAVNRFADDAPEDVRLVVEHCARAGVPAAAHDCFARGGEGGEDVARLVLRRLEGDRPRPHPPYDAKAPFEEKLAGLARLYGADGVDVSPQARASLEQIRRAGLDALPPCVAKTPLSISDDATLPGAPRGWTLRVRDVRVAAGAGYVVALCGDILLMPGFGASPAAHRVDLRDDGAIVGL